MVLDYAPKVGNELRSNTIARTALEDTSPIFFERGAVGAESRSKEGLNMKNSEKISNLNKNICRERSRPFPTELPETPRRWAVGNRHACSLRAVGVVIIFLSAFLYLSPPVLAVSAEKGDFIVLGRTDEAGPANEMVNLWEQPGEFDIVHTQVQSDTTVLIVDKTRVNSKDYYLVSTVGRGGGMMGWVSEDYIYKIVAEPPRE